MKLIKKLKTSNNSIISIESEDPKIINHFEDPRNFTEVILNQINFNDIYGNYFKDKKDLVILDCGGNVGIFSLYASTSAKKIISIEPTPNHFYILQSLTKDYQNIKPIMAAVSDRDGEIDFFFNEENTTMNSIANNYNKGAVKVKGFKLKTILDDNGLDTVDFAKIDIEGSEMISINESTISELNKRIKFIFMEVHATSQSSLESNKNKLMSLFNSLDYEVKSVDRDSFIAKI